MLRDDSVNRLKNQEPLRGLVGKDSLVITRNQIEDDFGEESHEMFNPNLDNDDMYMIDRKSSVKKGFFSMIDNVLGGAQSKNISMISNTYNAYQNVPPNTVKENAPKLAININLPEKEFGQGIDISPTIMKQQKLYDNGNNTTMMSSNYVNSFNYGAPNQLDNSLFENKPANTCYTSKANFSNMLFQQNQDHQEFEIRKMKSTCEKTQTFQDEAASSQQNSKKRSRKAYTKRSKKADEIQNSSQNGSDQKIETQKSTSCSVKFAPEITDCRDDELDDSHDGTMTCGNMDVNKLTNKKKQYLQDAIIDKNGAYTYLEDPVEYKKARKRLQNRESAVRSRHRKKTYQETLEQQIEELQFDNNQLKKSNRSFQEHNSALSSENVVLKQQVAYFQETFANSSLVGAQPVMPINKEDYIHKADLDKFKLELIQKINNRFLDEEKKEVIRQEKFEDCTITEHGDDEMIFSDPMETIAGDYKPKKKQRRARINSGQLASSNNEESFCSSVKTEAEKVYILDRENASSRGKGYFFLAVMFGMMCCSSYSQTIPAKSETKRTASPKNFIMRDIKSHDEIEQHFGNMNLISSDVSDEFIPDQDLVVRRSGLKETAHLMKNIGGKSTQQILQSMQGPLTGMLQSIMTGKYNYLGYLMCSTACCYFWMTPNQHKLRLIKPKRRYVVIDQEMD